jgi:hypothetical protein
VSGINIDKTVPTVSLVTPPDGIYYSTGAQVNANYSCTDDLSGGASCTGTVSNGSPIDTASVGSKLFSVIAVDRAGNSANASSNYTVGSSSVDTTPPVITPTILGVAGNDGWFRSDIQVSWSVVDGESAITASAGCSATTVRTDTSGTTLTCSATSGGGSASRSITLKRDTVKPVEVILSPLPFLKYPRNSKIPALSGIAECKGSVRPGALIDTSTPGEKSFSVMSVDRAGNSHESVVRYQVN